MTKNKFMIAVLLFWIGMFGGYIAYQEYALFVGTQVWLQTKPVDPNDFFRGDYVVLSYTISDACDLPPVEIETGEIDASGNVVTWVEPQHHDESDMTGREKMMGGKLVYVPLQLSGDVMVANGCFSEKPTSGLYIKGLRQTRGSTVYGIEKYFVQQGAGTDLEKVVGTIQMQVSISKNGQARMLDYRIK